MLEIIERIAAFFGAAVIAGGALTSLVLWLFKLFGEKWLSNKFAERLEAFKHDQQKEIEHLRFEINKVFDRTTKLHQREYDVLPKAWSLLVISHNAAAGITSPLQSYPDIGRMSAPELEDFLSQSPLGRLAEGRTQKRDGQESLLSRGDLLAPSQFGPRRFSEVCVVPA